ncbi:MAG TPA: DUF2752 domain-containing protein [Candidatus Dormibacteraeota bacterium]|nr:DUF2752 domain-containing protein [Candidatus Dormibacteraeota bacterium]
MIPNLNRAAPLMLVRAQPQDRMRELVMLGGLAFWLVYTRMYFVLQAAHLSAPVCPFYYVTGHPCPFCGGTRSFAYMWQGDLTDAVRLYPLGPALFAGSVAGLFGLLASAVSGRQWLPRLTRMQWQLLGVFMLSALVLNWALKVFVLGN